MGDCHSTYYHVNENWIFFPDISKVCIRCFDSPLQVWISCIEICEVDIEWYLGTPFRLSTEYIQEKKELPLSKLLFFTGEAFYHLDAPVIRVTGVDAPMPYAKSLESAALPQPHDIVRAVKRVLNVKW